MGDTPTSAELEALLECDFATAADALDHHVAATGDRQAIVYGETGETLTYAELGRTTDHVAGNLAALGVGPGSRVSTSSSRWRWSSRRSTVARSSTSVRYSTWQRSVPPCDR